MENLFRVFLCVATLAIGAFAQEVQHSPKTQDVPLVDPSSYVVYSAVISQRYQHWFKKNEPIHIAVITQKIPTKEYGNLAQRCSQRSKNQSDRELLRVLIEKSARPQKLEAKLSLPSSYIIETGKYRFQEGKEPGMVWLSPVVFSEDGNHAMVWVRNFCGELCGSGMIWKLEKSTGGWRVAWDGPGCGFIS